MPNVTYEFKAKEGVDMFDAFPKFNIASQVTCMTDFISGKVKAIMQQEDLGRVVGLASQYGFEFVGEQQEI